MCCCFLVKLVFWDICGVLTRALVVILFDGVFSLWIDPLANAAGTGVVSTIKVLLLLLVGVASVSGWVDNALEKDVSVFAEELNVSSPVVVFVIDVVIAVKSLEGVLEMEVSEHVLVIDEKSGEKGRA